MGLILFHIARSEDSFVQAALQGKPQIWEAEKWYNKLNMAENETGSHYTIDQVNEFPVPDMNDLLAYYDDIRTKTLDYLDSLTPDAFDKKVKLPTLPMHSNRFSYSVRRNPPELGGHTREILQDIGCSDKEIKQLLDNGVVTEGKKKV